MTRLADVNGLPLMLVRKTRLEEVRPGLPRVLTPVELFVAVQPLKLTMERDSKVRTKFVTTILLELPSLMKGCV